MESPRNASRKTSMLEELLPLEIWPWRLENGQIFCIGIHKLISYKRMKRTMDPGTNTQIHKTFEMSDPGTSHGGWSPIEVGNFHSKLGLHATSTCYQNYLNGKPMSTSCPYIPRSGARAKGCLCVEFARSSMSISLWKASGGLFPGLIMGPAQIRAST